MHYIRTELSENDKDILGTIYQSLEKIHIPTSFRTNLNSGNYHAIKIGTVSQKNARQAVFGQIKYRGDLQSTRASNRYPHIMKLFKEFINSHYSQFEFMSVYVNRNTIAKKHLDSKFI